MLNTGIQGQLLEVTVVGCNKLKNTEWISRQDPYVCIEYASTKFQTKTCTDGGKNPKFQEKFVFPLIEGLREINVLVWNSNTITYDDFIGSGKVRLQKVLSHGFDDSAWSLQTKTGRYAGEVKLIMHYANAKKPSPSYSPSAHPYLYSAAPPPAPATTYPPLSTSYPPPASAPSYAPPASSDSPYPPPASAPSSYPYTISAVSYSSPGTTYPSSSPYPSYSSAYPPSPYPLPSYPITSIYPPPPYPQSQPASTYYAPGPYPKIYPPPPY